MAGVLKVHLPFYFSKLEKLCNTRMMKLKVETIINTRPEDIWAVITDIENAPSIINGIEKVEVLDSGGPDLIDLKWKETRTLFGQTAQETMWVTEAEQNKYYKTRAESHGAVYLSTILITDQGAHSLLSMEFLGEPQTFGAKVMSTLMGSFMKGATRKTLQQDLEDIKAAVEKAA